MKSQKAKSLKAAKKAASHGRAVRAIDKIEANLKLKIFETGTRQHVRPCHDCPWRRASLPGWLGSEQTPEQWIETAHAEAFVECHVLEKRQCVGTAIYRRNVGKLPRDPAQLRLPQDRLTVFASPAEFIRHHRQGGKTSAEL